MKKKIVVPAALTAVLAAGGLLYFAHVHPLEKVVAAPAAPPAVPIVAGTVAQHDVPIYLSGVGTVIAFNTDVVRAQIQQAQVGELQAAIKADQALIDAAKVQLSYTRLTSPIEGVAGIRQIDVGNIISPSNTNGLVVVTQLHPISLIFTLPETNLPQIQQQQQKAKTPLEVLAFSQDNTIQLDQGVLGLVNNEILQTTGSIQLKANFDNKANKLWPGELVNARLLVDTRHNGLTVPAAVVQQGAKGPYAYVVNPDSTVAIRPIKVAQISDGQALIDSGLKANEQVVVDGQYKLQPGTQVTMLHGQAAQEAAAQDALQAPIP